MIFSAFPVFDYLIASPHYFGDRIRGTAVIGMPHVDIQALPISTILGGHITCKAIAQVAKLSICIYGLSRVFSRVITGERGIVKFVHRTVRTHVR